jgi:hypothetical protein
MMRFLTSSLCPLDFKEERANVKDPYEARYKFQTPPERIEENMSNEVFESLLFP